MAYRAKGRLALAALASAALALSVVPASPLSPAQAASTALPLLKGELGDFSYFDGPKPVPPLSFEDGQGHALSLASFKGRVVLVNFWATWCAPCLREMPSLDRLEAALGGKDFIVVDISLDRQGAAAVGPYFKEHELTHLGVYLDPKGAGFHAWNGSAVPTSFVIDREGRGRGLLLGPAQWDSPEALALIRHFIAEGATDKPDTARAERTVAERGG